MWLADHKVEYDHLVMRPNKDYRPDEVLKAEFADELVRRFEVGYAIDDRHDIVAVWQRAGIPTILVDSAGKVGEIATPS